MMTHGLRQPSLGVSARFGGVMQQLRQTARVIGAIGALTVATPALADRVALAEGQRVGIAVIEPLVLEEPNGPGLPRTCHATWIKHLITMGIGNGAETRLFDRPVRQRDLSQPFLQEMETGIAESLDLFSQKLNAIVRSSGPSLRIINFSTTLSSVELASGLYKADLYGHLPAHWQQQMWGEDASQISENEKLKRLVNALERTITQSPKVQTAYERYVETTRSLAERGIVILIPVGNFFERFPAEVEYPRGAEMNLLAKSDYVISVAAAHHNGTMEDPRDDRASDFSALGDGERWNPTITAVGEKIEMMEDLAPRCNPIISGTSYASPITGTFVGKMLRQNWQLTVPQVRNILVQTAIDTSAPIEKEGAGMVDVERAIALAAQTKGEGNFALP